MAERFVPLATLVRAARTGGTPPHASQPAVISDAPAAAVSPRSVGVDHEIALIRLAAREAFERNAKRLLATLAQDVLGRELALAPTDVAALLERALQQFAACEPVGIAVSTRDREGLRSVLPVRIDDALEPGDFVVEVRDGTLVSTFAARLDDALERDR